MDGYEKAAILGVTARRVNGKCRTEQSSAGAPAADESARSAGLEAVPSIVAATRAHAVAVRVGRVGWNTRFRQSPPNGAA
jgi:hypothetical protein